MFPASTSVKRVLLAEVSKHHHEHRITLYIDLTTFYETISHDKLVHSALSLGFPPQLLRLALGAYTGGRLLISGGVVAPPVYAQRGVLAGCSLAPALSKAALFPVCDRLTQEVQITDMDIYIDDISVDVQSESHTSVAVRAIKALRSLRQHLGDEGLVLSSTKSCFVCSSPESEKALRARLTEADPPRSLRIWGWTARRRAGAGCLP